MEEEIGKIGAGYGIAPEKMIEIIRDEDRKAVSSDMLVQKALRLIEDNAVLTEKASVEVSE